jgi:outer membrane protein assembly factor BamD (BamD/ComL family)
LAKLEESAKPANLFAAVSNYQKFLQNFSDTNDYTKTAKERIKFLKEKIAPKKTK